MRLCFVRAENAVMQFKSRAAAAAGRRTSSFGKRKHNFQQVQRQSSFSIQLNRFRGGDQMQEEALDGESAPAAVSMEGMHNHDHDGGDEPFVLDDLHHPQEPAEPFNTAINIPVSSKMMTMTRSVHLQSLLAWTSSYLHAALAHPSFATLYALVLLGSSVGFYLFVYFTSIGYSLGIGYAAAWLLLSDYYYRGGGGKSMQLHSILVVAWSIRLLCFLLHREFIAWPALHLQYRRTRQQRKTSKKQKRHQKRSAATPVSVDDSAAADEEQPSTTTTAAAVATDGPPKIVQLSCWLVYSLLYTCLASPCYYFHKQMRETSKTQHCKVALALQIFGLSVETVSDLQKSRFKQRRPADWCRVGIWKHGRHVNYAGEWLFWLGTYLAGVSAVVTSALTRTTTTTSTLAFCSRALTVMSIGFAFITLVLLGAAEFVGARQLEKYGHDFDYLQFRETHGWLGPNWMTMKRTIAATALPKLQSIKKLGRRKENLSNTTTLEQDDYAGDGQADGKAQSDGSLLL
ncbi:hypothetical protein MPSEU_000989400 [Mayamaea pseudoterrestris]|nr:hypothetical protein MPSEU_000989400 [Mayamaea pseudoterrestris]